eukprot:COSAG03_NODE_25584_length_264_cov_1.533333_2_plen_43_part_01
MIDNGSLDYGCNGSFVLTHEYSRGNMLEPRFGDRTPSVFLGAL